MVRQPNWFRVILTSYTWVNCIKPAQLHMQVISHLDIVHKRFRYAENFDLFGVVISVSLAD